MSIVRMYTKGFLCSICRYEPYLPDSITSCTIAASMAYIDFRTKSYVKLDFSFPPGSEFSDILRTLYDLRFPRMGIPNELIVFAAMELLSNSLRAHREKGIAEPVQISFSVDGGLLRCEVLDQGGGFDPNQLPYDLFQPIELIDIMSEKFLTYRHRYQNSRFGLGLFVVKGTFPEFKIVFIDRDNNVKPWYSGQVRGTLVKLAIPIEETGIGKVAE
jgi:anti-sigma regulatory factor (Ser/Thr protein kinase)